MKPYPLVLLACCALSFFHAPAGADIYRYVDDHGRSVFTDIPPTGRPHEVVVRDPRPPAPQAAPGAARAQLDGLRNGRSRYAHHVAAAARATAVDPALIHAVISAESGYNPAARSRKGALGLMQLMPETAKRYRVDDRLDPSQNIHGGARYLRDLLTLFDNDLRLAIAAYNAGEEAVLRYGRRIPPFRETVAYVPRVLAYYRSYRAAS